MSLSVSDAYLILTVQKSQAAIRKALQTQDAVGYVQEKFPEKIAALLKKKAILAQKQIRFICPEDKAWPRKLADLSDAPLGLFAKGNFETLTNPTVAIVGTRRSTVYGLSFAKALAKALALRNINVLSGLALGVDAAAHEGALLSTGPTTAVLGCGIDKIYPRENKELFEKIENMGLLLSEFEPGFPPSPSSFPRRNRIVSALADAVVVIESEQKGGAMITAKLAQKINRPLYALPGRLDNPCSHGPHQLIQEGATLIASVEDFINRFNAQVGAAQQSELFDEPQSSARPQGPTSLNPFLQGDALLPEEFASQRSLSFAQASAELMQLELEGFIAKRLDGRYEVRESDVIFDA